MMTDQTATRRARGRGPYLVSNSNIENTNWWEGLALSVTDWLRNNPLHLGLDDSTVALVRTMINRGNQKDCPRDIREKSFVHIITELEGVHGNPAASFMEQLNEQSDYDEHKIILKRFTSILQRYSGYHSPTTSLSRSPSKYKGSSKFNLGSGDDDALADLVRLKTSSALEIESYLENIESKKDIDLPPDFENDAKQERLLPPPPMVLSVSTDQTVEFVPTKPLTSSPASTKASTTPRARRSSFSGDRSDTSTSPSKARGRRASDAGTTTPRSRRASDVGTSTPRDSQATPTKRRGSTSKQSSPSNKSRTPRRKSSISSIVQASSTASRRKKEPVTSSLLDSCKTVLDLAKRRTSIDSVASAGYHAADESEYIIAASVTRAREDGEDLGSRISTSLNDQADHDWPTGNTSENETELTSRSGDENDSNDEEIEEGKHAESDASLSDEEGDDTGGCLSKAKMHKYVFSELSTPQRGKIQIRDTSKFQLDSFYRKRDRGTAQQGITLMMGRNEETLREQVVSVIFDRSKLTEEQASEWLNQNINRFMTDTMTHDEALGVQRM